MMTPVATTITRRDAPTKRSKRRPNRDNKRRSKARGGSHDDNDADDGGEQGWSKSSAAAAAAAADDDDINNNEKDIIWDEMFEEIRAIKEKTGTCNIPDKKGKLAKWVYAQRKAFRRMQCSRGTPATRAHMAKLQSIGFEFASSTYVSWDVMFEQYKNRKDIIAKNNGEEARKLKLWMSNQRLEYSRKRRGLNSNMTQERIAKLNSVGFQWVGRTGKPTSRTEKTAASSLPSGKRSRCKKDDDDDDDDDDEHCQKKRSKKPKRLLEMVGSNQVPSIVSHPENAAATTCCTACGKHLSEAVVSSHSASANCLVVENNNNNLKDESCSPPDDTVSSARDRQQQQQQLQEAGSLLECLTSLKRGVVTKKTGAVTPDSRSVLIQNVPRSRCCMSLTTDADSTTASSLHKDDAQRADDDSGTEEEEEEDGSNSSSETENESETSSSSPAEKKHQMPLFRCSGRGSSGGGGIGSFASLPEKQFHHNHSSVKRGSSSSSSSPSATEPLSRDKSSVMMGAVDEQCSSLPTNTTSFQFGGCARIPVAVQQQQQQQNVLPAFSGIHNNNNNNNNKEELSSTNGCKDDSARDCATAVTNNNNNNNSNCGGLAFALNNNIGIIGQGTNGDVGMSNPISALFQHQQLPTSRTAVTLPSSIGHTGMFGPSYLSPNAVAMQYYTQLATVQQQQQQQQSYECLFMLPALLRGEPAPSIIHPSTTLPFNQYPFLSTLPLHGAVAAEPQIVVDFPTTISSIHYFIDPR